MFYFVTEHSPILFVCTCTITYACRVSWQGNKRCISKRRRTTTAVVVVVPRASLPDGWRNKRKWEHIIICTIKKCVEYKLWWSEEHMKVETIVINWHSQRRHNWSKLSQFFDLDEVLNAYNFMIILLCAFFLSRYIVKYDFLYWSMDSPFTQH